MIYDAEYNTSGVQTQAVRFKIGDGSRTINNLPFALIDYDNRITSLENTVDGLGTAAQKDVGFFATAAQGTKADNAVPNTRKVNNKALSTDIRLEPSDVGVTESAFPGLKKTGTITGIKMNGASKGTSGVVDLGTVLTTHQTIKTLKTNNDTAQEVSASEAISGSGTINLHKVAKTGNYNDLSNRPTIPTDTGATSVEVTGTGNAVTAASYNATNRKLTLTKGSTFLTSHQDISGKANLVGGNTFKGKQTFTDPPTGNAYSIDASGCIRGSSFRSSTIVHNDSHTDTDKVCVFTDGGWIYYRTPAEIVSDGGGATTDQIPTFSFSNGVLEITT